MNYLTSEDGKPIKNTNPLPTQLVDENGNPHPFEVDENGYLKVNTNITSVTATDVAIHDAVTSANKLVINPDGTIGVQVSGSKLAEQKTQANAVSGTLTFSTNISTIEICNTDSVIGVFTVNGIAINVPAGGIFKASIGGTAGTTVTVAGAANYIVSRYE